MKRALTIADNLDAFAADVIEHPCQTFPHGWKIERKPFDGGKCVVAIDVSSERFGRVSAAAYPDGILSVQTVANGGTERDRDIFTLRNLADGGVEMRRQFFRDAVFQVVRLLYSAKGKLANIRYEKRSHNLGTQRTNLVHVRFNGRPISRRYWYHVKRRNRGGEDENFYGHFVCEHSSAEGVSPDEWDVYALKYMIDGQKVPFFEGIPDNLSPERLREVFKRACGRI